MTRSPDEQVAIDRLRQAAEYGTLIPVIGAGVSRQAANLPDWRGMLECGMEWSRRHANQLGMTSVELDRIERGVNKDAPTLACFELWTSASFANSGYETHWQHPLYKAWLEETFSDGDAVTAPIYQALAAMEPRVIITTNYDTLLRREVMPDGDVVTWDRPQAIAELFRERRGIFHLHGIYDRPESIVLTTADYERIAQHDARSRVARLITAHSILLFIGVSVAGATDRHLASLLKLSEPIAVDRPLVPRAHVLIHRGRLPAADAARLKSFDVQPVSYGDQYDDLTPFLESIASERQATREAVAFLGISRNHGEPLRDSRWMPRRCLTRVGRNLRFMGLRSSKWVEDADTRQDLGRLLHFLDSSGASSIKFLILNPSSTAYRKLENMRNRKLSTGHLRFLARLEQRHRSLEVRCVDFITAFRFTAVDDHEVGLAVYPTDPQSFSDSQYGWSSQHYTLSTAGRWTLARSLLFTFDQHFESAKPLRSIQPHLYT